MRRLRRAVMRRINKKLDTERESATCIGICLYASEILPGYSGVAYPHPECELHGEGLWLKLERKWNHKWWRRWIWKVAVGSEPA